MDSSDLKFTGAIRVPQQVRRSVVTGSRCAGRETTSSKREGSQHIVTPPTCWDPSGSRREREPRFASFN